MWTTILVKLNERVIVFKDSLPIRALGPGRHTVWRGPMVRAKRLTEQRFDTRRLVFDALPEARSIMPEAWFEKLVIDDDQRAIVYRNGVPELYFEQFDALMSQTHFCRTFNHELIAADSDLDRAEPPKSLGDIPLVVMSARLEVTEEELEGAPPHITFELIREGQDIFWGLHEELSQLSTNGEYIALDGVPHAIHLHAPEPVLDAISRVVVMTRQ